MDLILNVLIVILCIFVMRKTSLTFDIASNLITRRFPVLIEKPMTLNIQDSERLLALSKEYTTPIMVGHVLLFHPAIQKIKKLICSGKIGKLQYIYSNRLNLGQIRTEENVFWSFAPHDISILQYFTESFPIEINTSGGAFIQNNIHDSTLTTFSYPNNIKAHIYLSWLHPFKEHRIVIIGSEGMLSFEDSKENKPLKYYNKKFELNGSIPQKKDGQIELLSYDDTLPLDNELSYFVDNLDNSKKIFDISNGQNGLEVVKILELASDKLK